MQALVLAPLLAMGCAGWPNFFGNDDSDASLLSPNARPERIASLEAQVAKDHDTLEALVTGKREDSDGPLHKNDDLRAIAERLSQNEDELEALLRAERAEAEAQRTNGANGARATR